MMTVTSSKEVFAHILSLRLPEFHENIRRTHSAKVYASKIRGLFRELEIKGLSVTMSKGGGSARITVPETEEHGEASIEHRYHECPFCKERGEVKRKVNQIILAAFPDLNDRSESQSDYFDYCFLVA